MSERRTIAVRLSPEIVDRIDAQADERVVGRGRLIELVLERWLDEVEGKAVDTVTPYVPGLPYWWPGYPPTPTVKDTTVNTTTPEPTP